MIFTSPLGLLALLAIPAIVAIHLFRRRFPPRPVAGLFLWQAVTTDAAGRRKNQQAARYGEPDPGVSRGSRVGAHPFGARVSTPRALTSILFFCWMIPRRWQR
jgi:hypothetical protein